uniref:terminase large subunit domain-containing protein n=1 Tax=Novosphingobium rosa TaxID=76978 RepID=UPI00082C9075
MAPFVAKRIEARSLYWRGWDITQIAAEVKLPVSTVSSWKSRQKWDEASAIQRAEEGTLERYLMLVAKEKKTGGDIKEIDLLGRQFERFDRRRKYANGGNEADLNPNVENRNSPEVKAKKSAGKNLITPEMAADLRADFEASNFEYQTDWMSSTSLRTRMIVKSRQIGATWYFARERLLVALEEGKNQIFISASRAQANIFRTYIIQWVQQVCGVELKGSPMEIKRGEDENGKPLKSVSLLFLGTNYRTAQGYTGDTIFDECFWIYGFEDLFKVAGPMSTHTRFTRTLFSTPSTMAHEAYAMWSGEKFNKRRAKADKVEVDITHEALAKGVMGPDRIWRQIVTIHDAVMKGLDLVDIEELRFENSVEEFAMLFECEFVDDGASMFPLEFMRGCMVDSWEVWKDYEPYASRPYEGEVWLGYDPNDDEEGKGDDAALVAIAAPTKPGGKFRILEKHRMKGKDFAAQAEAIRAWTRKYRVTKIAIDTTGVGSAVLQIVRDWFPLVTAINYSPVVKGMMVLKAKNVISKRRLEFDTGWRDVVAAFMAIRPKITKQGITYEAHRGGGIGHADLAWAVMHALYFEPLDSSKPATGG